MAYQVPSNIIKASKLLATSVMLNAGGASAIANTLGIDRQYVHKAIKRGFVPNSSVYEFSELLEVTPWMLSYVRLMELFGEGSPPFEILLEQALKTDKLFPAQHERILKLLTNR